MKNVIYTPFILLAFSGVQVFGEGSLLSYGDKCSVTSAVLNVFTQVDDSDKCNLAKGLICTGTCTCPPTRVWYKGAIFGIYIFGGGYCMVGANGPCVTGEKCVDNASCGENVPLCVCNSGYYAREGYCVSEEGGIKGLIKNISNGSGGVMYSAAHVISITVIANLVLALF